MDIPWTLGWWHMSIKTSHFTGHFAVLASLFWWTTRAITCCLDWGPKGPQLARCKKRLQVAPKSGWSIVEMSQSGHIHNFAHNENTLCLCLTIIWSKLNCSFWYNHLGYQFITLCICSDPRSWPKHHRSNQRRNIDNMTQMYSQYSFFFLSWIIKSAVFYSS